MVTTFKLGFIGFIVSEIIFFFRFFWSYFHFLLIVSRDLGNFPGKGLLLSDFKLLPLLNTLLLLRRGVSLTLAHLRVILNSYPKYLTNIRVTLFLGLLFLRCQLLEYKQLTFCISDGTYSGVFYLTTSFHGSHVLFGWIMLILIFFKTFPSIFIVFELASWYWHFVDVIWLFLFTFYYWLINFDFFYKRREIKQYNSA